MTPPNKLLGPVHYRLFMRRNHLFSLNSSLKQIKKRKKEKRNSFKVIPQTGRKKVRKKQNEILVDREKDDNEKRKINREDTNHRLP